MLERRKRHNLKAGKEIEMVSYKVTHNGMTLAEGSLQECWDYLVVAFGDSSMKALSDQGYKIEMA